MPSSAYYNFKKNSNQVNKLIDAFLSMRPPTRGRKYLDHLTRSAIVFLCSSWEVYIEQITLEAGKILMQRIDSPNNLPLIIKKTISNKIKNSAHDLEPIFFCTDWKFYYLSLIEKSTSTLNTPKNGQVLELFNKYLGVEGNILKTEVPLLNRINEFVKIRGEIAHNVFTDDYVTSDLVQEYYTLVLNLVIQIEVFLWNYIPSITNGHRPWQKTY